MSPRPIERQREMSLDDAEVVRAEYASEDGLVARRSAYSPELLAQAFDAVVAAVAEVRPRRVLEVGCGWGELAARLRDELGVEVVATDLSPRMVELARGRGLDARVGDVQALPFADGEFDCVVAAWMLYHVPDLDRGLAEIARVLRLGGNLVATTTSHEHLHELWELVGRDRARERPRFFAETGQAMLRPHFAPIERRDVRGQTVFADTDAVRTYIGASVAHKQLATDVPDLDGPLVATCTSSVFVAAKR